MTEHICITFTTAILGLHIYEYYSSNSSTSKHTVLTSVNHFSSAVSLTCARASRVMSAAEYRRQFMHTDSFDTCVCGVWTLTLFNIDVKNTFSCCRCQLLCCYSVPLLWLIYLHATRVTGISVCILLM